jgi:hypothetical protein
MCVCVCVCVCVLPVWATTAATSCCQRLQECEREPVAGAGEEEKDGRGARGATQVGALSFATCLLSLLESPASEQERVREQELN